QEDAWSNLTIHNSMEIQDHDLQKFLQKHSPRRLFLTNCPNLTEAIWSALPTKDCSLKILRLEHMLNIKNLGFIEGFLSYTEKILVFPNLEELTLFDCSSLEQINIQAKLLKKLTIKIGVQTFSGSLLRLLRTQSQQLEYIEIEEETKSFNDWH